MLLRKEASCFCLFIRLKILERREICTVHIIGYQMFTSQKRRKHLCVCFFSQYEKTTAISVFHFLFIRSSLDFHFEFTYHNIDVSFSIHLCFICILFAVFFKYWIFLTIFSPCNTMRKVFLIFLHSFIVYFWRWKIVRQ